MCLFSGCFSSFQFITCFFRVRIRSERNVFLNVNKASTISSLLFRVSLLSFEKMEIRSSKVSVPWTGHSSKGGNPFGVFQQCGLINTTRIPLWFQFSSTAQGDFAKEKRHFLSSPCLLKLCNCFGLEGLKWQSFQF